MHESQNKVKSWDKNHLRKYIKSILSIYYKISDKHKIRYRWTLNIIWQNFIMYNNVFNVIEP